MSSTENNAIRGESEATNRERLGDAMRRTVGFFRENQRPDGHWVAELEGDALLQSETILLLTFLGQEDSQTAKKCAEQLRRTMLSDGGWEMYPGAGADVTNSVKAYFALKLVGDDPASEPMIRTREKILALGGAERVNSFTRFYLALLGQIPYDQTPAVPPQMMFLPKRFPVNIYAMSSWSRTIFVPLSIVSALEPVRKLPPERGIGELMTAPPDHWPPLIAPGRKRSRSPFSWDFFFRCVDKMIWRCRKLRLTPLRSAAIRRAKNWTREHFRDSDGPGAIYPPIVWAWIAFKALGYSDDSEEIRACRRELEALYLDSAPLDTDQEAMRVAPCKSPVWDTSLTMKALRLAGVDPNDPMILRGEDWLRSRQIQIDGDWRHRVKAAPGGWAFEYKNPFYPDNDDTAMALMVLGGCFPEGEINRPLFADVFAPQKDTSFEQAPKEQAEFLSAEIKRTEIERAETERCEKNHRAVRAGRRWLLAMQNRDGGWGAFDRGNTLELLCRVPFADHNAMIDPSTADLTGRVLESFGRQGDRLGDRKPFLTKCARFMRRQQESDGSWFGRWGVNYLYGTWQALTGLTAIGVSTEDRAIRAGADWLLSVQQENGGWGESPDSYADPSRKAQGTPTASQTAWAVMGLCAAGRAEHPATRRGVAFLLDTQLENGRWREPEFTGTGFPRVFYLRYHYYSVYFPLMALSIYAALRGEWSVES